MLDTLRFCRFFRLCCSRTPDDSNLERSPLSSCEHVFLECNVPSAVPTFSQSPVFASPTFLLTAKHAAHVLSTWFRARASRLLRFRLTLLGSRFLCLLLACTRTRAFGARSPPHALQCSLRAVADMPSGPIVDAANREASRRLTVGARASNTFAPAHRCSNRDVAMFCY